ncbi:hypothetical protein CspeluHIS016_0100180 [Cutaneotrichosporon spelunceum]|uniref:Uncharacterized protein n=1 Tax=Cutaneotrichosporon spelunceum TaxID=1672016 RepID=A0AAD3TMT2_9TREE|nr:hypothetical protein CspeluHIS016_0100180 [Cutaneotrichosporon spelunceum]
MCLDASAFPHILDGVIDACQPDSLIALRPVSQALCAHVDRLLFAHIVVAYTHSRVRSSQSGPAEIVLTTPSGHRLPTPPLPTLAGSCASLNATLRPMLRHTRVATLRSMSLIAATTLAPLLPRLEIVHRFTAQPWDSPLLKAKKYVDHVDFARPPMPGGMPLGYVPDDLDALVFRFYIDTAQYPAHAEHPPLPGGGAAEHLPLVEELNPPHIPAITVVADPTGPMRVSREFTGTVAGRVARAHPRTLTLVAFDELGPAVPTADFEVEGYGDGMDVATRAGLIEHAQWGLSRARVEVGKLTILSRQEWEAGSDVLERLEGPVFSYLQR